MKKALYFVFAMSVLLFSCNNDETLDEIIEKIC